MISPNATERLVSLTIATALHVALGWALLQVAAIGAPPHRQSGRDDGRPLVVDLLSLDHMASAGAQRTADAPVPTPSNPSRADDDADSRVRPSDDRSAPRARHSPPAHAAAAARPSAPAASDAPAAADPGAISGAEMALWRTRLQSHLARHRLYPESAANEGRQGVVLLHFIAARDGTVVEAWIESSSGMSDIDREAIAAILRAQPLPPFPGGWPARLDFRIPVSFRIG